MVLGTILEEGGWGGVIVTLCTYERGVSNKKINTLWATLIRSPTLFHIPSMQSTTTGDCWVDGTKNTI